MISDPIFIKMLLLEQWLVADTNCGAVVKPSAPDWVRALVRFVHNDEAPDPYVLDAIRCIALSFYHTAHTSAGGDGMEDYRAINDLQNQAVDEAADDFARDNRMFEADLKRWLMWQGNKHWHYITLAMEDKNIVGTEFLDLLEEAMRAQVFQVAEAIFEFFFEQQQAEETEREAEEERRRAETEGMPNGDPEEASRAG